MDHLNLSYLEFSKGDRQVGRVDTKILECLSYVPVPPPPPATGTGADTGARYRHRYRLPVPVPVPVVVPGPVPAPVVQLNRDVSTYQLVFKKGVRKKKPIHLAPSKMCTIWVKVPTCALRYVIYGLSMLSRRHACAFAFECTHWSTWPGTWMAWPSCDLIWQPGLAHRHSGPMRFRGIPVHAGAPGERQDSRTGRGRARDAGEQSMGSVGRARAGGGGPAGAPLTAKRFLAFC